MSSNLPKDEDYVVSMPNGTVVKARIGPIQEKLTVLPQREPEGVAMEDREGEEVGGRVFVKIHVQRAGRWEWEGVWFLEKSLLSVSLLGDEQKPPEGDSGKDFEMEWLYD